MSEKSKGGRPAAVIDRRALRGAAERNLSMVEAAQILKVSRTTLNKHLAADPGAAAAWREGKAIAKERLASAKRDARAIEKARQREVINRAVETKGYATKMQRELRLTVSKEIGLRLKDAADLRGVSRHAIILEAIEAHLDRAMERAA